MVDSGDYFCINRGLQYGKTTTLNSLKDALVEEYTVFSISFEGADDSFLTLKSLEKYFFQLLWKAQPKKISKKAGGLLNRYTGHSFFFKSQMKTIPAILFKICALQVTNRLS